MKKACTDEKCSEHEPSFKGLCGEWMIGQWKWQGHLHFQKVFSTRKELMKSI